MMSGTSMMDNSEFHSHYLIGNIPAEIAENLKEFFPEHEDLSYEEVLLQQESAYQAYGKNKNSTSNSGQSSNRIQSLAQENESSGGASVESQLALDEALARSLELGDDFEGFYITEYSGTMAAASVSSTESRESPPRGETPARATSQTVSQDDVDPDNMTYEELQSLGEAVGHENRGLSEDLISRLPTFKYNNKTGWLFPKKREKEECVICREEYKKGTLLASLPCTHQYHSECIKQWLKLNKNCPVCQGEVRDN